MGPVIALCVVVILIVSAIIIAAARRKYKKKTELKRKIKGLAENTLEVSPEEFIEMRKKWLEGKRLSPETQALNFVGVYILYNKTKNKYYVGQGRRILNRVNSHFTGKGNGDVYADYKYGDEFTIKMISLENSGCESLNELERLMIAEFDAYASGYNKTKGNM